MLTQKNTLLPPGEIVREALSRPSIFKNEEPLSLEWLPSRLPHRETQLRFLAELFRSVIDRPGTTSPKILVTGDIGTGKTVLTQRFGTDITRTAKTLKLNLQYIHINCREFRGSLFMILKRVLQNFTPQFPQRGFSSEELLHILLDQLESKNLHIILTLDEADVLIKAEGSTSLYNLTRIQEERPGRPVRLSLIVIIRELRNLDDLDRSTKSTLQRNVIRLDRYTISQLESILRERVELARIQGTLQGSHPGLEVCPEPRRHRHSLHPALHRRLQRKNNTPRTTHSPCISYTPMARIEPSTPALNRCLRNIHSQESSPAQDESKY